MGAIDDKLYNVKAIFFHYGYFDKQNNGRLFCFERFIVNKCLKPELFATSLRTIKGDYTAEN